MSGNQPVRCQKCGKPVGYITVLGKSLFGEQAIQNVKIVAVCMNCRQKKFTIP
jgi:DNA-directed RNA polymerase subunit N (RpoN/RPB10)